MAQTLTELAALLSKPVAVNDVETVDPRETMNLIVDGEVADATIERTTAVEPENLTAAERVERENKRRESKGRRRMTAEEARTFATYSARNAATVEDACEDGCTAYVDVFTFNRWIAQGRVVMKGEKATKIPVWSAREVVDEATGEKRFVKTARMVPVFCRCQTKQLEQKGRAA